MVAYGVVLSKEGGRCSCLMGVRICGDGSWHDFEKVEGRGLIRVNCIVFVRIRVLKLL